MTLDLVIYVVYLSPIYRSFLSSVLVLAIKMNQLNKMKAFTLRLFEYIIMYS